MARRAFIADVTALKNSAIASIDNVSIGEDGEDFAFRFKTASGQQVLLRALATDVAAYPKGNTYFLSADNPTAVPSTFTRALEDLQASLGGLTIHDLLTKTSSALRSLATGSSSDPFVIDDEDEDIDMSSLEDDSENKDYNKENDTENDDDDEEDYGWYSDSPFKDESASPDVRQLDPSIAKALNRRIIQDLKRVKWAGFRIGILSGMKAESTFSMLSISLQVNQLGLSDEALQAWDLERHQYIVLLIRYSGPYETFEEIVSSPVRQSQSRIAFRMGVSDHYKPSLKEASAAFTTAQKYHTEGRSPDIARDPSEDIGTDSDTKFRSCFISSPMKQLMDDLFLNLLKLRHSFGYGWEEAKYVFKQQQSRADNYSHEKIVPQVEVSSNKELPMIVTADHFKDGENGNYSLPLIAMQFVMLYFMRCTEFCLVCHTKTEETFEALKPYVCSNPLCLYQYMSLGFGPSIEHEILAQPYVVDLLISFCHASAQAHRLREYPVGMGLTVPFPHFENYRSPNLGQSTFSTTDQQVQSPHVHEVSFDAVRKEVILDKEDICNVKPGDWVQISTVFPYKQAYHCKVTSYMHPRLTLANPALSDAITASLGNIRVNSPTVDSANNNAVPVAPQGTSTPPGNINRAKLAIYEMKFDDLDKFQKEDIIVTLLSSLPSVKEMKAYLWSRKASSEARLRDWVDRISPAALGLLRWIVASNRSCIIQVDKSPGQTEEDALANNVRLGQKVSNMDGWMQFRFAQGSPDKEHRFHQALIAKQATINPKYPTIFAWHGSSLYNWHGIIRTGLDFNEIANGRAFGNGCYHSPHFTTSLDYCNAGRSNTLVSPNTCWRGSDLQIRNAICLNEIVNAPKEFQSAHPHLVIQHVDWIQCRYLFVQCENAARRDMDSGSSTLKNYDHPSSIGRLTIPPKTASPKLGATPRLTIPIGISYIQQDPTMQVYGPQKDVLKIPRSAFPASRVFRLQDDPQGTPSKRHKNKSPRKFSNQDESDIVSDESDIGDITFLLSDDESDLNPAATVKGKGRITNSPPLTDFIPGSLDKSSIQLLAPPSHAMPQATSRLHKDLKELLKVQNATPLHELGWYIDGDISNMFQWVLELHSFENTLPLAIDMKAAGLTSIVLELRFGLEYPMSPPFVRVIRPRFLPYHLGGGGHVTAGGAMCMELLTNSGWSAVSSIESVLLQVRMAMCSLEPKPARLESTVRGKQRDYGVAEAVDAYERACRSHGWRPSNVRGFVGETA